MLSSSSQKVLLLAGPTASGKSDLALALAQSFPSVIINADALQAYQDLSIVTARPWRSSLALAPHFFYGHLKAHEVGSVSVFLNETESVLSAPLYQNHLKIIVGGTGLYLTALDQGITDLPAIAPEIRAYWREKAEKEGPSFLYEALLKKCPEEAKRLSPSDSFRLSRALEVFDATGLSLQEHHAQAPKKKILTGYNVLRLQVQQDLETLNTRIHQRCHAMVEQGALDEVRALGSLKLAPSSPLGKAVGVRSFQAYLSGTLSLDAAIEHACTETRHYAKRQRTWIKKYMTDFHGVKTKEEALAYVQAFMRSSFF